MIVNLIAFLARLRSSFAVAALFLIAFCLPKTPAQAQAFDFENTNYFVRDNLNLFPTNTNLANFSFTSDTVTHPIHRGGIFFPITDFAGRNLWLQVRHLQADPNGRSLGHSVPSTSSSPFRSGGFGGWGGFLYQFDIYADTNLIGTSRLKLNGLFPASIFVESIETLSGGEWISFDIKNTQGSPWALQSINFTGQNPNSRPEFSATNHAINEPSFFSPAFPANTKSLFVISTTGGGFSEFRISADSVSTFTYGYEYPNAGGYQGMRITFGGRPIVANKLVIAQPKIKLSAQQAAKAMMLHGLAQPANISIYNMQGKLLATYAGISNQQTIALPCLQRGVYLYKIESSAQQQTGKFVW